VRAVAWIVVTAVLLSALLGLAAWWTLGEPTNMARDLAVAVVANDATASSVRDAGMGASDLSGFREEYLHGASAQGLTAHVHVRHVYSLWPLSLAFEVRFTDSNGGARPNAFFVTAVRDGGRWLIDAYGVEAD